MTTANSLGFFWSPSSPHIQKIKAENSSKDPQSSAVRTKAQVVSALPGLGGLWGRDPGAPPRRHGRGWQPGPVSPPQLGAGQPQGQPQARYLPGDGTSPRLLAHGWAQPWGAGDQPCCVVTRAGPATPRGWRGVPGHRQGLGALGEAGQEQSGLALPSGPKGSVPSS